MSYLRTIRTIGHTSAFARHPHRTVVARSTITPGHFQVVSQRHFSYEATVAGFWQTLSQSAPVAYVQQGMINLHDLTGLPWWATVILTTVGLRTLVTLPLAVYQNKILARLEQISLEMPELIKELKAETAYAMKKFNWTEKEARIMYNHSVRRVHFGGHSDAFANFELILSAKEAVEQSNSEGKLSSCQNDGAAVGSDSAVDCAVGRDTQSRLDAARSDRHRGTDRVHRAYAGRLWLDTEPYRAGPFADFPRCAGRHQFEHY